MPATEEVRDVLKSLIETCRDAASGYLHAAARVEDPALKEYFERQSIERGRFAFDLDGGSQQFGDLGASQEGTVAGLMHRAWFEVKADVGGGDHEILVSVEQGENYARKAYEQALNAPLPGVY